MGTSRLELRNRSKRRADMVNGSFVTDAEWNDWINEGGSELHDLLVSKYGDDYFLDSVSFSLIANVDAYDLPGDFLKVRGVDVASGNRNYALRRFEFEERNTRRLESSISTPGARHLRYRIVGNQLKFVPKPVSALGALTLWYIPQYTNLTDDAQKTPPGIAAGWEEYMVITAAMKAMAKEESDTSQLAAEKAAMSARIEVAASNRDATESSRVVDVEYINHEYDTDWGVL